MYVIINWNFIWNIDLNNSVYCDLRNKCACLNTVLQSHNTTHTHNWPLQHFSQDYGLVSHTTHIVGVNFIYEWLQLQFNVDFEWLNEIFGKAFHGYFIFSFAEFLPEISWKEFAEGIYFFFIFCFSAGSAIQTRSLR